MTPRFVESRTSARTVEWESLPIVGQDDDRFRARFWRFALAGIFLFWAGVGAALVTLVRG